MTRDAVEVDGRIHKLLENVIKKEGFSNDCSIKVETGSEAGDGYCGVNSAVEITNGDDVLKLYVKAAPTSAQLRSKFIIKKIYNNEIYFYETVYPALLKFQTERNLKQPFNNVARYYESTKEDNNEALILENLREKGFVLFNRKTQMNDEHITYVLKQLALYHAISFTMKDQDPQLYEKLTENLGDFVGESVERTGVDRTFIHYCEEAKKLFDPKNDSLVWEKIQNLTEVLLDFCINIKAHVDDRSVIVHGDTWSSNMMFKYQDNSDQTSPSDIKFLDWQLMRLNSPVVDLSYFFYTVASKEVLTNLEFYQKVYHDALSERVSEMGSDPEKLYPYSVFKEHWKKFSKHGLLMSLILVKIMLTDKDEAINMSDSVESGQDFSETFVYQIKDEQLYKQRVRDIVEHFVKNKLI